ncbi:hypothetical protein [Terrimonas alba]|uniref:hypothetical protein n=1 Tax=Terrimonas alba TaxID=3349636 RepID=UPI0035F22CA5
MGTRPRAVEQSKKYVPEYKIREELKKQLEKEVTETAENKKAHEMAKTMKAKGYKAEEIAELTGLSKQVIQRIKV